MGLQVTIKLYPGLKRNISLSPSIIEGSAGGWMRRDIRHDVLLLKLVLHAPLAQDVVERKLLLFRRFETFGLAAHASRYFLLLQIRNAREEAI